MTDDEFNKLCPPARIKVIHNILINRGDSWGYDEPDGYDDAKRRLRRAIECGISYGDIKTILEIFQ